VECYEQALLRAFLTDDLPEGRVIVPIAGQSGVGKSHVIRWLDTQLRGRPDADRRVVIRIPKGVSLREVLRILLGSLPPQRYGHYREELERAQHEIDSHEASGLLCEMLAHVLEEMGRAARERRVTRPDDAEAKEREAYCGILPALLRNQYLRDNHFLSARGGGDGPVRRLVEHVTTLRRPGTDDDRKHGFVAEDLDFGDLVSNEALGRIERQAITSLRPERREGAARILNLAIDEAKQRLLRIGPSTISDLFDSIRRDLLADDKELVLLVEDFVVLSGLQKQLLQVVIKEAVRDGRQVLCTLRTALAYTTGYLDADTVLTRAHIEYRIPDESSEDDIFARVERLVGAYLNAARLGQTSLERAFKQRERRAESWIPRFAIRLEADAAATLEAFGSSQDGYELFPLNRTALRQLAREGCVRNGLLVYNPRFIIQNVINVTLTHRALFETGRFPPATFGLRSTQVGASVADHVRRAVPETDRDRHLRFLAYWAGSAGAGDVADRIFEAFNLKADAGLRALSNEASRTALGKSSTAPPEMPTVHSPGEVGRGASGASEKSTPERRWDKALEDWRSGGQLPQRDADLIRKLVFDAALKSIEWDWFVYRPGLWGTGWAMDQRKRLYLPRAGGGEGRKAEDAIATVCADADLQSETESARVKLALMGLIRLTEVNKNARTYDGIENDLAAAGPLVERVASAVRPQIEASYFGVAADLSPAIVEVLLVGARALGITGADKDDNAALTECVFAPAPDGYPLAADPNSNWSGYAAALAACMGTAASEDGGWRRFLLDLVGARQGSADKVYAVDAFRLKPLIEGVLQRWSHASSVPPRTVIAGADDLDKFRTRYNELRKLAGAVDMERDALIAWRERCMAWMGNEFDKNEVLGLMKAAADAAHDSGIAREINIRAFHAAVEAFRGTTVKAALDDIARLSARDRGFTISVLGRKYVDVMAVTNDLISVYDDFESKIYDEFAREQMSKGVDPLAEAVAALQLELETVAQRFGAIDGND
jgi:hypothetical protein